MHELGTALLYVAFLATLGNGLLAMVAAIRKSEPWLAASRHGLVAVLLLFLAMDACLLQGLLTHDFRNKYIAAYTDMDMPLAYLISGFWGGEKGALLFWTTALSAFSVASVLPNRSQRPEFLGWVTAILSFSIFFFAVLMVFESSPFEVYRSAAGPEDGKGMNPLLQNPLMAIHPPSLLTGYIAFTVPFAFGLAALITGHLDAQWLRDTRKWTLVSWLFLSLGLILGGAWAYNELGWGGFWMWDPVENAGLIPWFTATAFLHSVMIQERRNMLQRWNAILVCLTFLLTIFGTFLTRSQLIDSVHAFADSTLASYFLWYMAIIAVVSTIAVAVRWKQLRSPAQLDAVMSRESFFVLNNVLLVGCAFVVLWGTVFGQISEAKAVQDLYNAVISPFQAIGIPMEPLTQKVQLGEPWFNRVMTPLGLMLLLMTGVGPLISWRRATRKNFEQNFKKPLVVSSLATLAISLLWLGRSALLQSGWQQVGLADGLRTVVDELGATHIWGVLCVWFATFVVWTIALEFHVGARSRQRAHEETYGTALLLLTLRNQRRYGGYIVHLGVVFCFLAFTGNAFRSYQPEVALHPGDKTEVGDYALLFLGSYDHYEADGAYVASSAPVVTVHRDAVVPQGAVDRVLALGRTFGPAEAVTHPGVPRVELVFANAEAGRRLGQRWFASTLRGRAAGWRPDPTDPLVLHGSISSELQEIMSVTPQVVMKLFADLRDWARDRAPSPVEVVTVKGQIQFQLKFSTAEARTAFLADLNQPKLAGVRLIQVNPRAKVPSGAIRVDVVPDDIGDLLTPEVRFYKKHSSPTTEVAIRSTIGHDLYLAMRPAQGQRFVNLLAVVFPFVSFLWLGAIVMLLGGVIAMLPARRSLAVAALTPPPGPIAGNTPAAPAGLPEPTVARNAL
jgi:cytochrome c-type biogenesis protein CcmF